MPEAWRCRICGSVLEAEPGDTGLEAEAVRHLLAEHYDLVSAMAVGILSKVERPTRP